MEEERKFTVYIHVCPNNKKYVGMSQNPKKRWANGKGYNNHGKFRSDIQLFGWSNIKHEILKSDLTLDEACYWEKYYIKKFNTQNPEFGYNTSVGGEKPNMLGKNMSEELKEKLSQRKLGKKLSEEWRKNISKSMKGKNVGKLRSEESKEKNRQAHLGKKESEETKKKKRQVHLGKKQSEECRKKRSESLKGRKCYNNGEICIRAYECPEGFVPGMLKRKNN